MNRIRTPSSWSSGVSPSIRRPNISISAATSSGERLQFSVENEYTVSSSIAELDGVAQTRLDRVGAGLVPRDHRQTARLGPAAVAVGDDRDVAGRGPGRGTLISGPR